MSDIVSNDGKESYVNVGAYSTSTNSMKKELGVDTGLPTSGLRTSLNILLASTVDLKFRAHGFHWNVKGTDFAQYHELFESIYGDLDGSIDPIAENLLKIGFDAPFQIREYATMSQISPLEANDMPSSMAIDLYKGLDSLLILLNNAFSAATSANEQGVANFLADRIDMTRKWMWQLRASVTM